MAGTELAEKCIAELRKRDCDPLLLFWSRYERLMQGTAFGRDLSQFMNSQGVRMEMFEDYTFLYDFYLVLRAEANKGGVVAINPDNFVDDCGEGGKKRVLEKLAAVKWTKPYQTFCFQTRGVGISRFVITKTFQDGLIMLKDIYASAAATVDAQGRKKEPQAVQLLEHCWGDDRICRMLIDWELEEHRVDKRFSQADAERMAADFPRWFVDRLRDIGAVSKTAEVKATVKNKSRTTERGYKVSYHFIFNVVGIPSASHAVAAQAAIQPWRKTLELVRATKSFACLEDSDLKLPVWGVDHGVLHGRQGFSVLLSRKTVADALPRLDYYLRVMNPPIVPRYADEPGDSVTETQRFAWAKTGCSVEALDSRMTLAALYSASYTPPTVDGVEYCPGFARAEPSRFPRSREDSNLARATRQEQAGVATPNPLCQRSRSTTALPPFLAQSVGQLRTDGTPEIKENTWMPCLEGVLGSLVRCLPEEKGAYNVSRVSGCPCPVSLALPRPKLHIHSNNGVYVVSQVGQDVAYLACTNCKLVFQPSSLVEVVRGTESARYSWFRYDKRAWCNIISETGHAGASSSKRHKA